MAASTTPEADEVLERALKLSPTEREAIALRLLDSIDPPPNSDADWGYWKAEIKRRIEAFERGEMKGYTLEEAMSKIRKAREDSET